MKINLSIISHKLKARRLNTYINDPDQRELISTRLFSVKLRDFDSGSVYIGQTGDIMASLEALPVNIICIGYGDISVLAKAKKFNILQIDSPSVVAVLNDVQSIFDFYNNIDNDLTNEIMREGNIQSILDVCTRFFDNPVYLIDSAKKLIGQSSNLRDPKRVGVEKNGFVDVNVINELIKFDLLSDKARKPKINDIRDIIPTTVSVGIFVNSERIASVCVEKFLSDISDSQFGLLEHVANMLTVVLKKDNYFHYVQESYSNRFLYDLINGVSHDVDTIQSNLANLRWDLNDEYVLLKIISKPNDVETGTLKYNGEMIKNLFKGSVMLIVSDIIVIVINVSKSDNDLTRAFESLREFLEKRDILCGMSMNFFDFSLISVQYSFATAAVEIGKTMHINERLFSYEHYIIPHILSVCDQKLNLRTLCHPAVIKLYAYDKMNETNYLYSLYEYIKDEKSLVLASKSLNIHRSTLIYRLNKINEIVNIDMGDADIRFHILLSYAILNYLDKKTFQ